MAQSHEGVSLAKLNAHILNTLEPRKKGYPDGNGLYFVKSERSANWLFKYSLNGRAREMGLGRYPEISLSKARSLAADARTLKAQGIDPIDSRTAKKRQGVTFEEAAREYWSVHCRHYAKPSNWIRAMELHVFPHIGQRAVVEIVPDDVIKFMKPIWGFEKARKLRQWINAVIGYVSVDDPRVDRDLMARVANRLGPQNIEYENHPAIPWQQAPKLWLALPDTPVGLSMKMLMLTGVRVNCICVADWDEFDIKGKTWTIPEGRVKHWKFVFRVPLTGPMIDVLRVARRNWGDEGLLFPSEASASGHLSNNAHRAWLHKHGWQDADGRLASAHGLRTTLRNWLDDVLRVDFMLGEHIIQHMKGRGDRDQRAYLRTDQLDRRREAQEAWSDFVISGAQKHAERRTRRRDMNAVAEPSTGRTYAEIEKWARGNDDPTESREMTKDEVEKYTRGGGE